MRARRSGGARFARGSAIRRIRGRGTTARRRREPPDQPQHGARARSRGAHQDCDGAVANVEAQVVEDRRARVLEVDALEPDQPHARLPALSAASPIHAPTSTTAVSPTITSERAAVTASELFAISV